uniref:Uncharacterized protein n=1 Tax=Glossina pallidipes TaxID=7398 RepID=A0A1B0A7C4_GLOPL
MKVSFTETLIANKIFRDPIESCYPINALHIEPGFNPKEEEEEKYFKKETKQHSQDLMKILIQISSRIFSFLLTSTSLFCTTDLVLNEINLMQIDNFMTDGPAYICNHKTTTP